MTEARTRLYMAQVYFKWRPHETQRAWLLDEHKVKVAACGRRWGKTEAQAIDAATYALVQPGSKQMVVAPTYDQSKLIFDTVERLLLNCDHTRPCTRVVRTPYPRIEIGNRLIMARTADEDGRNLRGHFADRVIVDEAAYVKDSVVEEVIAPMLADADGQLIMISTPFGKNHFYRAFMLGGASERYAAFRFPSCDNPHISRAYIEQQREVLSARQFGVEYEAEFLDDQNSVFRWDDIQAAISPRPYSPEHDSGWRVAGIDWARYSDYTTVVILDVSQRPYAVVAMDRFNQISWQTQVERVADFLQRHRANAALVDQTSVGDALLEQLRTSLWQGRGANMDVDGLVFTNTAKREIVDNLVVRLAHRDLNLPDDEQLVRELQYYEYELTAHGNMRMNARSGHTDDLVIALALAAWAAKDAPVAGDRFLSAGRRGGGPVLSSEVAIRRSPPNGADCY